MTKRTASGNAPTLPAHSNAGMIISRPTGQPVSWPSNTPKIGLALGGGGARGLAHIAMLEALSDLGITPCAITGTSIGAIYGAAYASNMSPYEIRAHTQENLGARFDLVRQLFAARADPISKLWKLVPVRGALLKAQTLLDLVLPMAVPDDFKSLTVALKVVATDYYAQRATVLESGPLRLAIAASMALPAIFSPVMIEGRAHVDGGLVNPLPFDLLDDCDITIAIDVTGSARAKNAGKPPTAINTLVASSQIFQNTIIREKLRACQPDIFIDVGVNQFNVLEFHKFEQILQAAQPAKERLKRQLGELLETGVDQSEQA